LYLQLYTEWNILTHYKGTYPKVKNDLPIPNQKRAPSLTFKSFIFLPIALFYEGAAIEKASNSNRERSGKHIR